MEEKKQIIKNQLKEIKALISFDEKLEKILNSGCIDLETVTHDNYRTAKNILIAILEDTASEFKPLSEPKKHLKEIENIKLFI